MRARGRRTQNPEPRRGIQKTESANRARRTSRQYGFLREPAFFFWILFFWIPILGSAFWVLDSQLIVLAMHLWISLLLFPSLQDDPAEIRAAVAKIRAGETPEKLEDLTDPRILRAISQQIRNGKACSEAVLVHLCNHAAREDADALLALLSHSSVKVAYAAAFGLAPLLDQTLLPDLEKKLEGTEEVQIRTLTVLVESRVATAGAILTKRLAWLDADRPERAKALLRALAACRVRAAHEAVLAYYEKTEDDLAVKALGRIWETKLDAPLLERSDEIRRLSTLLLVRRLALSGATNETFCDALLRLLTKEEFEKFLADYSAESFFARRVIVAAALARGFDRTKGMRLAESFLASPDAGLVGQILVNSPYELPREKLAVLLDQTKDAKIDAAPEHSRVCDLAVWRLTLQIDRREDEIPPELEKRDERVRNWKERLRK